MYTGDGSTSGHLHLCTAHEEWWDWWKCPEISDLVESISTGVSNDTKYKALKNQVQAEREVLPAGPDKIKSELILIYFKVTLLCSASGKDPFQVSFDMNESDPSL